MDDFHIRKEGKNKFYSNKKFWKKFTANLGNFIPNKERTSYLHILHVRSVYATHRSRE